MTTATRVVLATRNPHKVAELRDILGAAGLAGIELVGLDAVPDAPDVVEDGLTFVENSLLKARSAAEASGLVAIADDSGLGVDVLGGAPGIFSARWSGAHGDDAANLRLLLGQLADVKPRHRGARFECAAVAVHPDGREAIATGTLAGTLTYEPRGAGGFGYDPIFVPEGETRTTAELTAAEKHAISHRGRAFRELALALPALLG